MPWQGAAQELKPKLDRMTDLIDKYHASGYLVSLLGTSAGGSAVINVYAMRKAKMHKVINVCGRLRSGEGARPTLKEAAKRSKSFYDSVLQCEKVMTKFTGEDCRKILTFRPLFDELVPPSTVTVPGAKNVHLPAIEHIISIMFTITMFSEKIVGFVLED